jgi:acyl-CoA synthetase (AMP-forming)/AMP-acid ligase II
MQGYWQKPQATADALIADGWFRTGDVGELDADGYLFLRDRLKDTIISGGENIYPAEVENALQGHPDVVEVAVIGVPDERWGETPSAVVVCAAGSVLSSDDLIDFARGRLARYKCPTSITFVDVLPRNATGKVLRRELREPHWAGRERQIN